MGPDNIDQTGGAEFRAPGQPENLPQPEGLKIPEHLLVNRDLYTVPAPDLIKRIKSAEVGENGDTSVIERRIMRALPFTEGLAEGVYADSYDLAHQPTLLKLWGIFLDSEGSRTRFNDANLKEAIADTVTRPLREYDEWSKPEGRLDWRIEKEKEVKAQLWAEWQEISREQRIRGYGNGMSQEEIEAKVNEQSQSRMRNETAKQEEKMRNVRMARNRLRALELHVSARGTYDRALIHRQYVAHDKELQGNMRQSVGLATPEPNNQDWLGLYQYDREFGEALNAVERRIVEIGMSGDECPDELKHVFAKGFTVKKFKRFMEEITEVATVNGNKRMDAALIGWRISLLKEIPAKFGCYVDEKGRFIFGDPPICSDWASNSYWTEEKFASEIGWNEQTLRAAQAGNWDGKVVDGRTKAYKALTHSPHPSALGHIANRDGGLVPNFMEHSRLPSGTTLWEVWWEDGISMASDAFPWADTDVEHGFEDADEPAAGSWGYWALQRGRAMAVRKDMVGLTDPRSISTLASAAGRRNWDKLKLIKPTDKSEFRNGEPTNPMAWQAVNELAYYVNATSGGETRLEVSSVSEKIESAAAGTQTKKTNAKDHVQNLVSVGALSSDEQNWIHNKLRL